MDSAIRSGWMWSYLCEDFKNGYQSSASELMVRNPIAMSRYADSVAVRVKIGKISKMPLK